MITLTYTSADDATTDRYLVNPAAIQMVRPNRHGAGSDVLWIGGGLTPVDQTIDEIAARIRDDEYAQLEQAAAVAR